MFYVEDTVLPPPPSTRSHQPCRELPEGQERHERFDITIILDRSASLSERDFEVQKSLVIDVAGWFSILGA